jgi:hypothetical protein
MAELLILVVVAGVVLLYAVDRARKLRARARQMSGMNERLDVAAAKVDEQQERKQARVRASAELTSVLPAIKRPPLTLPGVPGPADEPGDEPAAAEPQAEVPSATADDGSSTAGGTPPAEDSPGTAGEAAPEPARSPEGTLTMGRVIPDTTPAPKPQMTSDDTMIMPSVPAQGPAPAGEAARPPAPPRTRPRASQPRSGQQSTSQEQADRD